MLVEHVTLCSGKKMGIGVRDGDLNPVSVTYIFNYLGQVVQHSWVSIFTSVKWGCNATQDESVLNRRLLFNICRHSPLQEEEFNLSHLP